MSRWLILVLCSLLASSAAAAPAAAAPVEAAKAPPVSAPAVFRVELLKVVVLEPQVLGGAQQGALVAEEIARALPSSAFKVTTAAQLQAVLGMERQRQLLGCGEDSNSCVTELANALGTDVIATSTLARTSDGLRCNVVFMSGRDGTALERVSVEAGSDGELFEQLYGAVSEAAARLFATQRPGARLEPGQLGVRRFAWAPGLAALVLGGGAAALFAISEGNARTLENRQGLVASTSAAYELAATGRTTQTVAWVLAGTGVAALATAGLMFTVGAPTEAKVVLAPAVSASGAGVIISGALP